MQLRSYECEPVPLGTKQFKKLETPELVLGLKEVFLAKNEAEKVVPVLNETGQLPKVITSVVSINDEVVVSRELLEHFSAVGSEDNSIVNADGPRALE